MQRRNFIRFGGTLTAGSMLGLAAAQTTASFPIKNLRLVVPLAAGGPVDVLARSIAEEAAQALGQPMVVDNRPGAAGFIAAENVAKSPADGYSLLLGTMGIMAINPHLYQKISYNAVTEFVPIAYVAGLPYSLIVSPKALPVKSVPELIAYAKAQGKPLPYGSYGSGSVGHVLGEMFRSATGLPMIHVPYRGTTQAMTDLVSGEIAMMFDPPSSALGFTEGDRLRILAVTSANRMAILPNVPTLSELGFKNSEVTNWLGVFAPAGTPKAVVERLAQEIARAAAQPKLREKFAALGIEMSTMSTDAFGPFSKTEYQRWGGLMKKFSITLSGS